MMTDEKLLTVAQVAAQLHLNPETVRRWLRDGKIQGIAFGVGRGGWRIRESELQRFLAARELRKDDAR
jgi:excisionase family DNA binding protein